MDSFFNMLYKSNKNKEYYKIFPFQWEKIQGVEYSINEEPINVKVFLDKVYLLFKEANSLLIIDNKNDDNIVNISLDNYPCDMYLSEKREEIYISSFLGECISIIDCREGMVKSKIREISYPSKILLSKDEKVLFISEHYENTNGEIAFYSLEDNKIINRVEVGSFPYDLIEDEGYLYVSSIGDGTISIIDLNNILEVLKINACGIGGRINKEGEKIYINNIIDDLQYEFNLSNKEIRKISCIRGI